MSRSVERRWVKVIDSRGWRRVLGSAPASRLRATGAVRSIEMARRSAATKYAARRTPDRFAQVETLCVFVGHVKSGGSLIGAMLDAHRDALVSDEVDLLRYVEAGFGREQLCHLVEKGSRREAMKGRVTARRLDPYSLAVPGSFQGRSARVRVLGDVRAGPTTRRLGDHPELLDRLEQVMAPTKVRLVHVVRNPFDPISAMVRRGGRTLANATDDYAQQCRRLLRLRAAVPCEQLLTLRYEDVTAHPRSRLADLCTFVGLEQDPEHLDACSAVVQAGRPGERSSIDWPSDAVEAVDALIESVPFLHGYRFS